MMSTHEANRLRRSAICPAGNHPKIPGDALCASCQRMLPHHMLQAVLFVTVGDKGADAYEKAIRCVNTRSGSVKDLRGGRHTQERD